jgi:UDP-N-acetylglucosamine enolpyruvyl transferase
MDQLLIRGGQTLKGELAVSGAKNAALPQLCAALLTPEPVVLRSVPRLHDVATMAKLLRTMGARVERSATEADRVDIDARHIGSPEAPYELVKTMRASILCPCLGAARSARGRWTSTSRACKRWARRSGWSTATSAPRRPAVAATPAAAA